ncbi:transcription initiation protein, putative [Trichomonas vaginalis G3]|uniref:Transcription initiation protein, putative n=1 Tax=Trichomonas vaginalis (strain ATCC PRA-98 / G3) TaxID=412133 RepID=A2FSB6_TRIV3|nr:positive regulation of DNA-templated transcription, elongation [Trichomonas vaginalis G3]EAX92203.1 transcription initiation protein, putative [Trichomonas vaginalis G3]KAI5543997.1 positive regulation of DNA-templated transcription, elongation [Trichomonas vaginalis G3]|eukprot:XP_001305133.1 transcription initiation protein [Trichomonas vaginalis G3]
MAEDRSVTLPKKSRSMAACIGCGLIQDRDVWKHETTCPNCGWTATEIDSWVSNSFNGILALFQPQKSWCSSWLKYNKNVPGIYCIDNLGEVTDTIVQHLESYGRPLPEWVERYKVQSTQQKTH